MVGIRMVNMASKLQIFKLEALPSQLVKNALYIIKSGAAAVMYVTDKDGAAVPVYQTAPGGGDFYATVLPAGMSATVEASEHNLSVLRNMVLLNPARRECDLVKEYRSNGDAFIESNIDLNNHILILS